MTEFIDAVEIRSRRKELNIKQLIETHQRDGAPFVLGSDRHDWNVYPLENSNMLGRERLGDANVKLGEVEAPPQSRRVYGTRGACKGTSRDAALDNVGYALDLDAT